MGKINGARSHQPTFRSKSGHSHNPPHENAPISRAGPFRQTRSYNHINYKNVISNAGERSGHSSGGAGPTAKPISSTNFGQCGQAHGGKGEKSKPHIHTLIAGNLYKIGGRIRTLH